MVRGSNLSLGENRFKSQEFVFVSDATANRLNRSVCHPGDIIFTKKGTIGQTGIIPNDSGYDRFLLSSNQMKLTVDPEKAIPLFVYYFVSSTASREKILQDASVTGVPKINLAYIRTFPILLPSLEEQKEIVGILCALDERIELLQNENLSLEQVARAIFKSWFVDFDPVRAKAEGREPEGMDTDTAALFPSTFEDSELGPIPQGWKSVPFGALLDSAIGGDWGKEEPDEVHSEQVAIIRGTDMPTIQAGYTSSIPARFVSAKKLQSRRLRDSDIIIEVSGGSPKQPTGRSIFVSDALLEQLSIPTVPASFCRLFRATDPRVGLLLSQHLSHIYGEGKMWGYQNQSTGISNFQTKHFLESEYVCLPSDEVLDAFQQIVRPMIDKQQLKIASTLADLRDTLLPRLIAGKLRVPEAEAMLTRV